MKDVFCFLNGRYMKTSQAKISVMDRGFLFGEGLFEAWRTYRGLDFALPEHLKRMKRSADALGIPFNPDEPWQTRSQNLSRRNGYGDCGAVDRLTITRGSGEDWLLSPISRSPTRSLMQRPLEGGLAKVRDAGVSVHLLRFGSGVHQKLPKFKTLNYLPAILGKSEARKRGCYEGIYHLDDGTVLEGTTSNLFIVSKGRIFTTAIDDGILPGVTRAVVIRLAKRRWPVAEEPFTVSQMMAADEVFLTSTAIEVVPVVSAQRRPIGSGQVGPITRQLQLSYRRFVARRLGLKVEDLGE